MLESGSRPAGLSPERLEVFEYLLRKAESARAAAGTAEEKAEKIAVREERGQTLSFAQRRLWFLDQMQPGTPAYNMAAVFGLRGRLSEAALEASLREIVRRHEVLRTTFELRGGLTVPVVSPPGAVVLPRVDLDRLPEAGKKLLVERLGTRFGLLPFDLRRGPLLRVGLLRLDEDEHVLLLSIHHIASDGWSIGVFFRELTALYRAVLAGRPSPLEELPVQYSDFASWQMRRLEGELFEEELAFWRRQLGGDVPRLDLPGDRPRPAVRSGRGSELEIRLSSPLTDGLRAFARGREASLFMVLVAALQILLYRLSGLKDLLLGTPVAGRDRTELEGLIGCFLNTLVLRTDLSGRPSFEEVLGRVREVTLDAYAHQQVPFERLLEELKPERNLSSTPFFQVLFNMLNFPKEEVRLPELSFRPMFYPETGAKFDLTIYAEEHADGLRLRCAYTTDLFDERRIEEILAQFELVLGQALGDPGRPIESYGLVTPASRGFLPDPCAVLDDAWRGPVHEVFAAEARSRPNRLAVEDPRERWTYSELRERSRRLAGYLRRAGIRRSEVVAIYAHRSAALVWSLLGVMEAGAAFLILDPAYPASRLVDMARLAGVRGWLEIEAAGPLQPELEGVAAAPSMRCRLSLPNKHDGEQNDFLAESGTSEPAAALSPDELAYVAFTSGSTGIPKGILGRHGPLSFFVAQQRREPFRLGGDDRFSVLSGLSHDPLQREVFTALQLGATLVIPEPRRLGEPGYLAEWMRDRTVTVAHLTPAMAELLSTRSPRKAPAPIPSLRRAYFIGDALPRRVVEKLSAMAPECLSINHYGTMETQRALGCHVVAGDGGGKETVPLGRGMDGVQLVVTNGAGRPAGVGEPGEIHVRSPHLARGYLDRPGLTAERFLPVAGAGPGQRLYRTGDLGRFLPDGNVEPLGRADTQIVLRGFRIEPGEIEAILVRHPEVKAAAVLARELAPGDRRLIGWVTPGGADAPSAGELQEYLRSRLPDYMVPGLYVTLDELPLTPNGKLDRRALPIPSAARPELQGSYKAPRNKLEQAVSEVWREVLKLEEIGVRDRFFELGGHSLQLVEVRAKLEERLEVEMRIPELFDHCTIESLAAHLGRSLDTGGEAARQEERKARLGAGKLRKRKLMARRRRTAEAG